MVQAMDNTVNRPVYNAVKINIKKPEINTGNNTNTIVTDNGIYNAVNIDIDNPTVNGNNKQIYDYPEAENIVTYDMANIKPVELPRGFHVAYQTTNVILPKIETEVEIEGTEPEATENAEETAASKEDEETSITEEAEIIQDNKTASVPEIKNNPEPAATEAAAKEKPESQNSNNAEVPKPNYTTTEAEKGIQTEETKPAVQRPEIIPAENIKPEIDMPLLISNLNSADFDIQAQQMEEIARISLDNPENAVPYIVSDVFASLIEITKKDTERLAAPTEEQIQARRKVIANFLVAENAKKANTPVQLPYKISEKEIALANEISPLEQAERNKEYALYTMAILAKVYTDEVEKQTGNIVPLTDIPGTSAMVDALRYSRNPGVKIAAIDALKYIQRNEYKEELTTLFTLAQSDANPQVSLAAAQALNRMNNQ